MKKVKLFSLVALSVAVVGVGSQLAETHLTARKDNIVYAWDDDNNSGNQGNGNQGNSNGNGTQGNSNGGNQGNNGGGDRATSNQDTTNVNTVDRTDPNNISNQLKGYRPVKSEDIQNARQNSGWLTDIIGMGISLLIILTFAFTGFITAADLFYLYFPPIRKFLYSAGTDGTGGMTGMGGMGGNGGGSTSFLGLQWVSDEAVAVSSMLGGSAQATGHGGGMMGGGFGGGYGGGFGGGFGAQPNDVQQKGGKSVIRVYLGKRVVALVLLGVASVLLFTSAFTDFGINAGGMILNILSVIQEKMSSINFGG